MVTEGSYSRFMDLNKRRLHAYRSVQGQRRQPDDADADREGEGDDEAADRRAAAGGSSPDNSAQGQNTEPRKRQQASGDGAPAAGELAAEQPEARGRVVWEQGQAEHEHHAPGKKHRFGRLAELVARRLRRPSEPVAGDMAPSRYAEPGTAGGPAHEGREGNSSEPGGGERSGRAQQGSPVKGAAEQGVSGSTPGGLAKTTVPPDAKPLASGKLTTGRSTSREAGKTDLVEKEPIARRVAKMLLVLGKEQAAEILRHLSSDEIERVTGEISRIKTVRREEAQELAGEFGALIRRTRLEPQGGNETAVQFLRSAFGEEQAQKIFARAVGRPARNYFDFLEELEPTQLIALFKNEAPAVTSIVLSWLSPPTASKVLQAMPLEGQREVVKRLSRMQKIDTTVLQQIEEAIKEKIRRQGRVVSQDVDGQGTIAAILRHMDVASGEEIIERFRSDDPELAEAIEQQLFTIESVMYIEDADLQRVLRELSDTELALILKGKREEIRTTLLNNLSVRRRRMVAEEYERLGPVPRRDVDEAVDKFVSRLRELEAEGKLRFIDQDDLVD